MADNIKISDLDELVSGSLQDTTIIPVVDAGTTQKASLSSLKAYTNSDVTNQSDLDNLETSLLNTINGLDTDDIAEGTTNKYFTNTKFTTQLHLAGVVSESGQIIDDILPLDVSNISDFDLEVSRSAAEAGFTSGGGGGGGASSWDELSGIPDGLVSSSLQLDDQFVSQSKYLNDISLLNEHTSSLNLYTQSLDAKNIISSSQQITDLGFGGGGSVPLGTVSSSQQVIDFLPEGTVSASGQIDLTLTNYASFDTSYLTENSLNKFFTTARVEEHLALIGLLTASGGGGGGPTDYITSSQDIQDVFKFWAGDGIQISSGSQFGDTQQYIQITATGGGGGGSTDFGDLTNVPAGLVSSSTQIEEFGFITTDGDFLAPLNEFTGSTYDIDSSSFSNRVTNLEDNPAGVPDGTLSSSAQIIYDEISNTPTFAGSGSIFVSQSSDGIEPLKYTIYASSVGTVDWSNITNLPENIVSGSGQLASSFLTMSAFELPAKITGSGIEYTTILNRPLTLFSSSQQITDFGFISGSADNIPNGTISGSSQLVELGFLTASIISGSPQFTGFYSSSLQLENEGFLGSTFSSSATDRLDALEAGGGGGGSSPDAATTGSNIFIGDQFITGSVYVSGSVVVDEVQVGTYGVGEPIITSGNNLNLSASNAVIINSSPLRFASFADHKTGSLTPSIGDTIYNPNSNSLVVYLSGSWARLITTGSSAPSADNLPQGIISGSQQVVESLPVGTVSGSEQIEYGLLSGKPSGIISESAQLIDLGFATTGSINKAYVVELGFPVTSSLTSYITEQIHLEGLYSSSEQFKLLRNDDRALILGLGAYPSHSTGNDVNAVVIGNNAGNDFNSGSGNVLVGFSSAETLVNGDSNTIIGTTAGAFLTTGSENTIIGEASGLYHGIGSGVDSRLTKADGSVFIGYYARGGAGSDSGSNQIVIGSGSIGNGSNTTTIGNGDTTDTYIAGNVLPIANESYDLGSPDLRFRDLYLSGSTIDLGGTLITRNTNGNIEFLDSGSLIQKSIELAAITGSVYVSERVTMGEALKLQPQHPLPTGEAGMMAVSGSGGGPFGLHFHNGSTWLEISFV